jgi:predicted RNase H-like HicB family nuclease
LISAYVIKVEWDRPAACWIATSADVPGLCAQAVKFDDLLEMVTALVPELLEANQALPPETGPIPLDFLASRQAFARVPA